jgi:hypothetical protein
MQDSKLLTILMGTRKNVSENVGTRSQKVSPASVQINTLKYCTLQPIDTSSAIVRSSNKQENTSDANPSGSGFKCKWDERGA